MEIIFRYRCPTPREFAAARDVVARLPFVFVQKIRPTEPLLRWVYSASSDFLKTPANLHNFMYHNKAVGPYHKHVLYLRRRLCCAPYIGTHIASSLSRTFTRIFIERSAHQSRERAAKCCLLYKGTFHIKKQRAGRQQLVDSLLVPGHSR